ncbi:uncharacterized protein LOC126550355 [Aphis gossypii]|uniref:uncharacterized protein LOC126550355 n=1 Tax=Aphis gossypii TaxID=80765 RepID=UPI002159A4B8|nr:uncharacterized protein LOC126550355 [Aphis gossypii]XP_050057693.1 uncharacterized protein LOC126550355 [Aphis gossypii]
MHFWNSFQKVATWSAASYLFFQRFLEIVSLFILDNKHICLLIPFMMTIWTIIYFANDFWMIYVACLIIGSVIFIFASYILVQRAGRRERYQILLEASRGYELAEVEALKRRFDAIFPPLGVLNSLMPREVAVADASRTIDERLGALEDAVRSLSAEFEQFKFNQAPTVKGSTNRAPTVQSATNRAPPIQAPTNLAPPIQAPTNRAPTNRAPPIQTSGQTHTVPKSWCYYHVRFGKEARKCSSELCTFTPKISTKNQTFKKTLYTSDKPEKCTYPCSDWRDF